MAAIPPPPGPPPAKSGAPAPVRAEPSARASSAVSSGSGHPTLVAPSRPYATTFPHQWQIVNDQTEGGLLSVKRVYQTLEKVAQCQLSASDPQKPVKELKTKNANPKLSDEMTAYARSSALAEQVVLDTFVAHHTFHNQVNTQIATPLGKWYKTTQKKRRDMEAKHVKDTKELTSQKTDLDKERASCAKLLEELKVATKAVEEEESSNSIDKKKLPKLVSNRKSAKEKAVKAFKKYNQNLQAARKFQSQYHSVDIPARLAELQQIEVERLNTLGTMLHTFQSLVATLQTEIQKSSEILQKVIPELDPQAEINSVLEKWVKFHGAPPEVPPYPYGLPCSPEELERDVFAGPGGDAVSSSSSPAPPAPPPGGPPRGETKSAIPEPPGPPAGGFTPIPPPSRGQPPPPAKRADAPVSRGAPPPPPTPEETAPAAATEEAGESNSVWARALFDFEDPGAEGEVNYISFKENEYLKVHQQEDEWWFGEKTDGTTGFFPKAYVEISATPPP